MCAIDRGNEESREVDGNGKITEDLSLVEAVEFDQQIDMRPGYSGERRLW